MGHPEELRNPVLGPLVTSRLWFAQLWGVQGCWFFKHLQSQGGGSGTKQVKHRKTRCCYQDLALFSLNKQMFFGMLKALVNFRSPEELMSTIFHCFQLLL